MPGEQATFGWENVYTKFFEGPIIVMAETVNCDFRLFFKFAFLCSTQQILYEVPARSLCQ